MRPLILIAWFAAMAGCSDLTYGRDLIGVVVSTGSRMKMGESSAEEKISIVVKADPSTVDSKIKETACGPSGCAIECLSTRCASLSIGSCHHFECSFEHRMFEPNIIACKHLKEVECP